MFFFLSAFNRASVGFSASFGISHKAAELLPRPVCGFPHIAFCTRLSEMPHFLPLLGQKYTLTSSFTLPLISAI